MKSGFEKWCSRASGYIYYPPDRAEVEQELMWHLEDTVEGFMADGISRAEAEAKALEAMGSPDDVGRLLRKVHKPWLGYLCWAAVIAVAILGICFLATMFSGGFVQLVREAGYLFRGEAGYEYVNETYYMGSLELIEELAPSGSVKCGDYAFRVSGAWLVRHPVYEEELLVFVLDYSSPRFWLGQPKGMQNYLVASDSEGEKYSPNSATRYDMSVDGLHYEKTGDDSWRVHNSGFAVGEFICRLKLRGEAEWVDIIYDHGERFDIRIYLEKGGGA